MALHELLLSGGFFPSMFCFEDIIIIFLMSLSSLALWYQNVAETMCSFSKATWVTRKNGNKEQTELKKYPHFFVYSIWEAYSLIFPVHLPLCSIYMLKVLLPLKWTCSWEFCFLFQSSHVTQFSNPLGKTDLSNLISFIWQICGKGTCRIWLCGAAFILH